MTTEEAADRINGSGGSILTVEFVKRTNGERRTMNCRLGVRKHLRGGEASYDPAAHGLICVYDMQKGGYRSINVDTIRRLTIGGQTFEVEPCPMPV
jgi:hypothetical protein